LRHYRADRGAFTLVELMVVIVIIAILMSIAAAAVSRILGVSQYNVSAATIRKVYPRLQSQRAAVMKAAEKEDIQTTIGSTGYQSILAAAGYNSTTPSSSIQDWAVRARVIYTKLRLRQEFPMTFVEACNTSATPSPVPAKQSYISAFATVGMTITPYSGIDVNGVDYQSAACLLKAIQEGRQGSGLSADEYGTTSVKMFTDKTSGKQVQALVDSWGTPLAYYRWPWGNTEVDALASAVQTTVTGQPSSTTSSTVRDPEDPLGLLMNANWYTNSGRNTFESWCHAVTKGSTQYAYYMIPVVVSAGPDMTLGLTPQSPNTTTPPPGTGPMAQLLGTNNQVNDYDNIYSFRLMPPGAKGD
jgi:prepilin-type N-terminal cleavage/methylation domain-containing protein